MTPVLYRVTFLRMGEPRQIYAKSVGSSDMLGFMEISDFQFGEPESVIVDPSVDKLRTEFDGVTAIYLPLHSIISVEEVKNAGQPKILKLPAGVKANLIPPNSNFTN